MRFGIGNFANWADSCGQCVPCDPASLMLGTAATSATATTAATAATSGLFGTAGAFSLGSTLTTLGTVMGIGAGVAAYNASKESNSYNAAMAKVEGKAAARQIREDTSRRMGAIRAARSKSGVTGEGTPLLVAEDTAIAGELDALDREWAAQSEATLYDYRTRSERARLPYAIGSSLLTGAGRLGALG